MLLKAQLWAPKGRNELLRWLAEGTVFSVAVAASLVCQTADSHHGHTLGSNWRNIVLLLVPFTAQPSSTSWCSLLLKRLTDTNTRSGQPWFCLLALVLNPARRAVPPPPWAMCLSAAQPPVLLKPIPQRERMVL